jgi:hypothetical protein
MNIPVLKMARLAGKTGCQNGLDAGGSPLKIAGTMLKNVTQAVNLVVVVAGEAVGAC